MKPRMLRRYDDSTRMNHWAVVLLFFCAALSGMALFHPSLYFFTVLFGGGPWARILHPFMGVLMALGFVALFVKLQRENRWTEHDRAWMKHAGRMVAGDTQHEPPVGKYNGGQKIVFWAFAISLVLLFATGFVFWRPYFVDYFPITLRRIAVVVHAASAVVLILSAIVHVYAALWVKGTMRAMTRGTVTENWARQHHPLWYREMSGRE